jgi:hypothetical protein
MLRGLASPAGLGLAGAGFASGFTGGMVDHLQTGGSWGEGIEPALASAATGAALGLAASGLNPMTYQYWRARGSTDAAAQIQRARRHTVGRHHQRNVAQYPEYSTPASPNNSWIDGIAARFTRGNVTGGSSVFPTEALHEVWHRQWGGRGTWSQRPSHGPWTPEINPTFAALPVNHARK